MASTLKTGAGSGTRQRWRKPVRLTALYYEHLSREAKMVEQHGWLLPRSYGNPPAEQAALRQAAGLLDIGESGAIDLKSDALDAVLTAGFPDTGPVAVGRWAVAGGQANTRICRLTGEQALILTLPDEVQARVDLLRRQAAAHPCTHATDLTGARCGLRLLGPHAPAVLERLCALDLAPGTDDKAGFAHGALAQGSVAAIHTLIVRRDTAGLPGYDLYVDRDLGAYLWDALLDAGAPLGLILAGRAAEEDLG